MDRFGWSGLTMLAIRTCPFVVQFLCALTFEPPCSLELAKSVCHMFPHGLMPSFKSVRPCIDFCSFGIFQTSTCQNQTWKVCSDLSISVAWNGCCKSYVSGLSFFPYQLLKVIWKTNYLSLSFIFICTFNAIDNDSHVHLWGWEGASRGWQGTFSTPARTELV